MTTPNQERPNQRMSYPQKQGESVVELSSDTALVASRDDSSIAICHHLPTGEWKCLPPDFEGDESLCYPVYEWKCTEVPPEVVDAIRGIISILT